jgi:hypothetical protein
VGVGEGVGVGVAVGLAWAIVEGDVLAAGLVLFATAIPTSNPTTTVPTASGAMSARFMIGGRL